jgi:hypothetical protein
MAMFERHATPRRFEDLSSAELEAFLRRGRSLRARALREQLWRLWSGLGLGRANRGRAWHAG